MGTQMIKIRSGAVDYGRIYEQKTAAFLSIRCALDPNIVDFWIVSNVDGFEAFDDIILLTRFKDGSKKMFCIQLKHLENGALPVVALESTNGRFNIDKYHDSYKAIVKNMKKVPLLKDIDVNEIYLILYTNAPLSGTDKAVSISLEATNGVDLVNTSSKPGSVWQVTRNSKKPLEDVFLQQFYIYVNQASATALESLIKNEFDSYFKDVGNAVIVSIADYFLKWSVGRKGKIAKISKKDVQMQLLEYLLQPYILEPKQTVKIDDHILTLLNDTLINFNVTAVSQDKSLENIFASLKHILEEICDVHLKFDLSWNTSLSAELLQTLYSLGKPEKQQISSVLKEKHHLVAHLTAKDLYLSAWQCKLIPLVLNCSVSQNSVQEVLLKLKDITSNLSFVLVNPSNIDSMKENLTVFNNFCDLKNTSLLCRNLEETYVSMQGKGSVKLKEFSSDILEAITPDVYMVLLNGALQLGASIETENYYIKRSLKRPFLHLDVLNVKNSSEREEDGGDIFLLVEFQGVVPVRYINHTLSLERYLRLLSSDKQVDSQYYILTVPLPHTDENVAQLATALYQHTKKAVHVVQLKTISLEWFFSRGSVENLQPYMFESIAEHNIENLIPEDNMLSRFNSQVNVISNNAGMGKTFMLKSLANKFDSNKWVCYINLSEHSSKISKNKEFREFLEYIFGYQISINDKVVHKFCRALYQDCWKRKNVVWLLDGYDEVSSEDMLWLLKQVRLLDISMWVTTRPTYQRELELLMDTLSLEITHFKEEDHVMFLRKYYETFDYIYGYNAGQIQYIIDTINKCSKDLDKTLIAIPLQTRMFAEIFGDDINQINEKERLTIVDLYNKFVDIKLKEYKSYEATSLRKTLSKLALKLFFTEDQLDELLDFEELAEEAVTFQESYKKDSIVIGLNENGDAVFGHRTFAEFLAGHWLAKQIVTRKGHYNTNWVPLIEKLYFVEMIPVRVFFDRILSQDLPLHLAVLNNDVEKMDLLLKEEIEKNKVDKLGRSPFHLAVSYGEYFDLYVAEQVKGLRRIETHSVINDSETNVKLGIPRMKEKQFRVPLGIVEKLLDNGFLNTTDDLFQYDAFDYAMKSCSLDALDALYKRFEKDSLHFEAGFNFKIFLYLVVYDNFYNILSKRKVYSFDIKENRDEFRDMFKGDNYKLFKMKYNDLYLTEIAANKGGKETVFELLQSGVLHARDGSPVHRACFSGQSNVIELLYKMGADIEATDVDSWSNPIHQSGQRGRADITYHFLKNSKFTSSTQQNAMTPLHYACHGGHVECIKKLIELGASVNQKDKFGYTPLMYAGLYGYEDVIEVLLKTLSKEQLEDNNVKSLINVAASKGYSIAKHSTEWGLDVNNVDEEGNTPLILASKNGFPNVIEELASKKCDLNLLKTNESVASIQRWAQRNAHVAFSMKLFQVGSSDDKQRHGGVSALHFAIVNGHVHCVKALVELGANKHIKDTLPGMGYSPLVWASMYGQNMATNVLLPKETEMNQEYREDIELAIIWASMLNYSECIKALLEFPQDSNENAISEQHQERVKTILAAEFGIDFIPAVRNFGEITNIPMVLAGKNGSAQALQVLGSKRYQNNADINVTLHWAARDGHLDCVKILVELGADDNVKNEKKLRLLPIAWASMYGRTQVVRFLLSNKSKEYLENRDVHLALNWAALGGFHEIVKMFIEFGLDVDNVDEELNGNTPLISACEYRGTREVIDLLLSSNCPVNKKNKDGLTALDFAAQKKNFEFVKILVCSGAFQNLEVDRDSDLYKNLQSALEWAVSKEDTDLAYKLIELGIKVREENNEEH